MRKYLTKPVFDEWAKEVAIPELQHSCCSSVEAYESGENCVYLVLTVEEGDEYLLHDTCEALDQLEVTEL